MKDEKLFHYSFFLVTFRNEDRDERNRKASYDVKEGTSDCEDWSVDFTA